MSETISRDILQDTFNWRFVGSLAGGGILYSGRHLGVEVSMATDGKQHSFARRKKSLNIWTKYKTAVELLRSFPAIQRATEELTQ